MSGRRRSLWPVTAAVAAWLLACGAAGAQTSEDAEYDYIHGLMDAGRFRDAEVLFGKFAANHPRSALLDKATYYRGLSLYRQERYREAAPLFADVVQRYPRSPLAAPALFAFGESLTHLGALPDACLAFRVFLFRYPDVDPSRRQLAAQERARFNCAALENQPPPDGAPLDASPDAPPADDPAPADRPAKRAAKAPPADAESPSSKEMSDALRRVERFR